MPVQIKNVEAIISPSRPHFVGDGFRVHNFIPSQELLSMQRLDPFIMLDYNSNFYFEPSVQPKGVDVHPHRGFETVTIAYKGKIEHHDSFGGGGIIADGDVQWMTAASGILHKEFHEKEWSKRGGDFQMVQLWINLPSKFKMYPPKYQAILNANIPYVKLENDLGKIEIIAGQYNTTSGVASTFSPIHLYNAKLKNGAKIDVTFPQNFNTALIVIEGKIKINHSVIAPCNHFVLMKNDGENFTIQAEENSVVLVLSGQPINEPIVAHGPFVMNTKQEIVTAFEDYKNGKFGVLENSF